MENKVNMGLLGPNGAGKTTTTNMIMNEVIKNDGNILFKDFPQKNGFLGYFKNRTNIFEFLRFGIVPQENTFYQFKKCSSLLGYFCRLNNVDYESFLTLVEYMDFK